MRKKKLREQISGKIALLCTFYNNNVEQQIYIAKSVERVGNLFLTSVKQVIFPLSLRYSTIVFGGINLLRDIHPILTDENEIILKKGIRVKVLRLEAELWGQASNKAGTITPIYKILSTSSPHSEALTMPEKQDGLLDLTQYYKNWESKCYDSLDRQLAQKRWQQALDEQRQKTFSELIKELEKGLEEVF